MKISIKRCVLAVAIAALLPRDQGGVVAGQVCVATVDTDLTVTFTATNWCMTQTHLDVVSDPKDFPTTRNGNPIPGQFEYQETYESCVAIASYTVPYADLPVFIAAHAVLWDEASGETLEVVSSESTPITAVNGVVAPQNAVLANEPFNYPNCASYTSSNASKSVWDNGIGTANFSFFSAAGADWIWNAPHPLNPRAGDVVTFQPTFIVPPGLVTSSSLRIAADNAFTVDLNGAFVGKSVTLGPDFPATLRETPQGLATPPQVRPWGVASQGWDKVETFVLPVVSGSNTLKITAANEYMCNASASNCATGADRYFGWNSTTKTFTTAINNDPMPGDGPGISPCYNPGGVIFAASIDYYARSETGWGSGTAFPGSNWATYFVYPPQ
jgi:hypothetical protein